MKVGSPDINLPQTEHQILEFWAKERTFYISNDQRRSTGKEFSFYDGPPFANGLPHYGHLLASTIKDIVPRYWNMRGYYVERRFGWDCHGLPVEYEVEKKLNLKGRKDIVDLGIDKFNETCRETVFHYAEEWQKTVTRIGRWVDWENQYRTMDKDFMESVWWVLSELYKKGLVYRDAKIVAYSPRITAVVSNFEANQNYKDVQDPSVSVKFKLADEDAYLIAWTTTPWTLISNLALAVGPEITYVKVRDKEHNEVYYLAKDRLNFVYKQSKKNTESKFEILAELPAAQLIGRKYQPLFPYFKDQPNAFQVLAAEFVTLDSGTGIVHCAPAYGEDDFAICRANGIDIVDPLDDEARYTSAIPEYLGQYVKDADKQIIQDLKASGKLLRQDVLVHSYPHCDRTDDPLIYRAVPSWYVAVEKIKDKLVRNNQTINWVPEHLRDGRMGKWLENARDWAISRNRFWGTPIPIWVSDRDDSVIEVIGSVEELCAKTGKQVEDLHKHHIDSLTWPCTKTGGTMRRIPDVFDCWFESGSMPYAQKHYPFENQRTFEANFPADFIAEGQDQTRGWFYTLAILSGALFDKPAFKNVIVNGIVLAEDGKKMSKRLKNYTAPDELLDRFGADSVRLFMLNSAVLRMENLKFSDEGVRDTTRAVILPLWNAYSFLSTYAEADGWQPSSELAMDNAPSSDHELDRWLVSRLETLLASVHSHMESYKLYLVVPEVLSFIDELTNWYIRLSRRRFWGDSKQELANDTRQAYETLFYVLCQFCKVFAPFAPFITEKIYQDLTDGMEGVPESVHLCDMPEPNLSQRDEDLENRMQLIRRATNLGRSLRAKHQIKTRQVLPSMLVITRREEDKAYISDSMDMLKSELNVKEVMFSTDEARYVRLSVKPNLKTLGRRLGKDLNTLRQKLQELSSDHDSVAKLLSDLDRNGVVVVGGHSLAEEDFLIERGPKDERLIATEGGVTVLLDTQLSEDLILEGLSREVVNRVQKLRKDSGLNVSDRIQIILFADEQLKNAITRHKEYLSGETLAVDVRLASDAKEVADAQHSGQFDIEGNQCGIGIKVVASAP